MKVIIKNRFTGGTQFEAEVEGPVVSPMSIRLRLAVLWAITSNMDLRGADLRGADLRGADLRGVVLGGADLSGADLRGATLRGADLSGATLRGADLRGVVLGGADLRGADLRGVVLGGADLRGATLRGADLSRADLRGADLRGATVEKYRASRVITIVTRNDGYDFLALATNHGTLIRAGCRTLLLHEYRDHVAREYPNTNKARETLDILDYIDKRAKALEDGK